MLAECAECHTVLFIFYVIYDLLQHCNPRIDTLQVTSRHLQDGLRATHSNQAGASLHSTDVEVRIVA